MSEAADHGITVTEIAAMDQSIDVACESTAAFIGRALRGPLNSPVLVTNFGEFRRRFGDVWPRASLGPAVKQFFEHGGRRLYVVRVANNARGAMLCLPARGTAAVLRAVEPGSTEHIRAAVDYDGAGEDIDRFNLTLQRVNPNSGLVIDQELFRRVSYQEGAENFIGDALLTSTLARLEHPYPAHRPEPTILRSGPFESSYVDHAQAGTDGTELTDYDLIGSKSDRTGLFALEDVENFDLLYLPPPGRGVDTGPAAVLAAELYCRRRGAMLILDPRLEWRTAKAAANGVRNLGYASPNMIGYFPHVVEHHEVGAPRRHAGGAIAGLLCRQDRSFGAWQDLNQQGLGLQRELKPAMDIDEGERRFLNRAGLNALVGGPAGRARLSGSVTLGRGFEMRREYASLPLRRFCLQIANSIAKATRWAVFESDSVTIAERIEAQVLTYFRGLYELGSLGDDHYSVRCDAGGIRRGATGQQAVTIVLVFQPTVSEEPVSLTLNLTAIGCRVRGTAFAPTLENLPDAASRQFT